MATHVTSADNPRFRGLLKLHQSSRERRKAGLSLLDGVHLVTAYLENVGAPDEIVVSRSRMEEREIDRLLASIGMPAPLVLSDALFRQLSSTATPTGVIAVVKTPARSVLPSEPDTCVLLEDVQDPGNIGSILRSSAAAGIGEVYLSESCAQAWSPRVLRAGMGAHFALRIYEGVDLQTLVRNFSGSVLALAAGDGHSLYSADLTGRVALVFGNEGAGISSALRSAAQAILHIPMPGNAESLNVAAAAAVCLFERVRQQLVATTRQ
jgi:TrmH family RNA methyltransferase